MGGYPLKPKPHFEDRFVDDAGLETVTEEFRQGLDDREPEAKAVGRAARGIALPETVKDLLRVDCAEVTDLVLKDEFQGGAAILCYLARNHTAGCSVRGGVIEKVLKDDAQFFGVRSHGQIFGDRIVQ